MAALKLPRRATMAKWSTIGAWFFIAFSLASVGTALVRQWADPSGTTRLYGDAEYGTWGLTYAGVIGVLLALVQIATIGSAAIASTLPRERLRRLGHRILMAWAGLWWLNLAWLAFADPGVSPFSRAAFMTTLFGATVYRATRGPGKVIVEVAEFDAAPLVEAGERATTADEQDATPAPDPGPGPGPGPEPHSLVARARPIVQKAAAVLPALRSKASPAMRSMLAFTRRGLRRLQNGWTTST